MGKVTYDGKTAGPVVVYVVTVPGAQRSRDRSGSVAQRNIAFVPRGVVVTAGAKVAFPNEDKTYHNVFSLSAGNEFDLGLYREGASQTATLPTPGEVDVYCNIHPDMSMKVLVLQNDLYVFVGSDGTYKVSGVPDGTWAVVAWAPDLEPIERQVTVTSGPASADFHLVPRPSGDPHTNKSGEQYGRYH